jgi:hypothetical protein
MLRQKQTHAEKKKMKKMETMVDQLNDGDPPPLHPPEKYHHAPGTRSTHTKQHLQEGKRPLLPGPDGTRVSLGRHREVEER